MGNFAFNVPSLGTKFIDYRNQILGDSFNWSFARPLSQVQYLTIHHAAGPDTQTPDSIAAFHVNTNGWGGIGYHFVIAKDGRVYYVGDLTTGRANVANLNHLVIGICLIGSFIDGIEPPQTQLVSTHEL
ncbi:MAG: peptidoglycan recognition family protein, partial [Patescibacteria group bacterium]